MRSLANPVGLYIHIPFCKKRCAYCDFYSSFFESGLVKQYLSALKKEMKKWGGKLDRPVDTVYIGGGTPSLLGKSAGTLIKAAKNYFDVTEDAEITVESNPESCTESFLSSVLENGANRLSLGVQSFNDDELRKLSRIHSAKEARNAYCTAKSMGFKNISLDLMMGLPNSDLKSLKHTLDAFLRLSPQHISAYILKIEENTLFKKQKTAVPSDDEQAEQYLFVCETLEKNGYEHYEISNFSKPSFYSKHNMKYWMDEEYLGIGPSAASFLDGKRFYYKADLHKFMQEPETYFDGHGGSDDERIMLGLRTSRGADISAFVAPDDKKLIKFKNEGFINLDYPRVSLTDRGMLLSNQIITELIS